MSAEDGNKDIYLHDLRSSTQIFAIFHFSIPPCCHILEDYEVILRKVFIKQQGFTPAFTLGSEPKRIYSRVSTIHILTLTDALTHRIAHPQENGTYQLHAWKQNIICMLRFFKIL